MALVTLVGRVCASALFAGGAVLLELVALLDSI